MAQTINPAKLKAAAEHLEWVLQQYPGSEEVQSLLRSLAPLMEDAKAGRVLETIDDIKIPGAYNFSEGRYIPYAHPSINSAYTDFAAEMRGGWTQEETQLIARLEAIRSKLNGPGHD